LSVQNTEIILKMISVYLESDISVPNTIKQGVNLNQNLGGNEQ